MAANAQVRNPKQPQMLPGLNSQSEEYNSLSSHRQFNMKPQLHVFSENKKNQQGSSSVVYLPLHIVTEDTSRETYYYDSKGRLLSKLTERWVNNAWTNHLRYSSKYDNSGNLLTELYERWANGTWASTYRDTYVYDNSMNMSDIGERWVNNTWVNLSRHSYTYDENRNVLLYLWELWTNNEWTNNYRLICTYDNNQNLITQLQEQWTNGSWENSSFATYTYDTHGNKLTELWEQWINASWENFYRETYSYNANGNILTDLREQWTNNIWENSYRFIHNVDSNGNLVATFLEYWNNGAWKNSNKDTFTYDNNGNRLTSLSKRMTNNAWVNSDSVAYIYDTYGNATHGEHCKWNNAWISAGGNLELYYNKKTSFFTFYASRVTIEYTSISGVNENSYNVEGFKLTQNYPNPFNPSTSINFTLPDRESVSLKIFNPLGELVAVLLQSEKEAGSHTVTWNAESIVSGIYFYELKAGPNRAVKKLLLLK